jgi:hypothetical protein
MVQLIYAITTLYRTRGDQIAIFGYAAFGLTVTQYAWMSFVNLLGNWVCPHYPSLYLVESPTLSELRVALVTAGQDDQFLIGETVGMVSESKEETAVKKMISFDLAAKLAAMPLVVIGALSRFSPGSSTLPQRVWTMTWLVFGFTVGLFVESAVDTSLRQRFRITGFVPNRHKRISYLAYLLGTIAAIGAYAAPAIGGFVVVGQMFYQYGVCFET